MRKFILALPATLAFIALAPMFTVFIYSFLGLVSEVAVPEFMIAEPYARLIFEGCIPTAAALFAVAFISLLVEEF